jgi:hypothetical protein
MNTALAVGRARQKQDFETHGLEGVAIVRVLPVRHKHRAGRLY